MTLSQDDRWGDCAGVLGGAGGGLDTEKRFTASGSVPTINSGAPEPASSGSVSNLAAWVTAWVGVLMSRRRAQMNQESGASERWTESDCFIRMKDAGWGLPG